MIGIYGVAVHGIAVHPVLVDSGVKPIPLTDVGFVVVSDKHGYVAIPPDHTVRLL